MTVDVEKRGTVMVRAARLVFLFIVLLALHKRDTGSSRGFAPKLGWRLSLGHRSRSALRFLSIAKHTELSLAVLLSSSSLQLELEPSVATVGESMATLQWWHQEPWPLVAVSPWH